MSYRVAQKPVWRMPTDPKPVLKASLIPVFRVHYEDVEAYIKLVFGFEYDLLMATGCKGGAIPEFHVTGHLENDAHRRQAMSLRNGQRVKSLALILNVLAADEYIRRGKYIVDTRGKPEPTQAYRNLLEAGFAPDSRECMAFKTEHGQNMTFMERAVILDAAALEQMERGK
jgi:hypothetical protein